MSLPDASIAESAPIEPPSFTLNTPFRFGCAWIMFSVTDSAVARSCLPFCVSTSFTPGDFRERLLAAAHALEDRHDRNAVEDRHFAAAADRLRQILASHLAGVVVLRTDERIDRTLAFASTATTTTPAFFADVTADWMPVESVGFTSRMSIFFCSMSSTSLTCLLTSWCASVTTTVAPIEAAASFERLLHRHEVRVVQFLKRHADFQRRGLRGRRGDERQAESERRHAAVLRAKVFNEVGFERDCVMVVSIIKSEHVPHAVVGQRDTC